MKMFIETLESLHANEMFFRLEDDEQGYYLSLIDRQYYPRVTADNLNDGYKIVMENTNNLLERTMIGGKDWIIRFTGETIEDVFNQLNEYLEK
jgi:hypothetical protein